MKGFNGLIRAYQFVHMLESYYHQRKAWKDAELARIARIRAESLAASQVQAMLIANPSGQLGTAQLNDEDALRHGGLL